ncbi:MAG: 4Fe-4S dicluster domain-containing protein [Candidatus Thorarchaeota archaeon]|nr:4Fe-4S dicluster domain-containing protein [Candidatus Thorarchaeota archaeon]
MTMVKRLMIHIDEDLCTGCANCVPGCAEGALQIIDGKAKVVSESFCDGLGACLGECPEGALTLREVETIPFNEEAAQENVQKTRLTTQEAECEGSEKFTYAEGESSTHEGPDHLLPETVMTPKESNLAHWPIKLKLLSSQHPALKDASVLIIADCAALAYTSMHDDFLAGKAAVLVCPKFEDYQQNLVKLTQMFQVNNVKDVSVMHMEVPCCHGLVRAVTQAILNTGLNIPLRVFEIGVKGNIKAVS